MRLSWRDGVATLLVGATVVVYIGHLMSASMPLINDWGDVAAAGLLLGFLACVIDEWTIRITAVVRTLSVLSVLALGLGIAAMATESESLVTVFAGTLVSLWVVTTMAHAGVITQRSRLVRPGRGGKRPTLGP